MCESNTNGHILAVIFYLPQIVGTTCDSVFCSKIDNDKVKLPDNAVIQMQLKHSKWRTKSRFENMCTQLKVFVIQWIWLVVAFDWNTNINHSDHRTYTAVPCCNNHHIEFISTYSQLVGLELSMWKKKKQQPSSSLKHFNISRDSPIKSSQHISTFQLRM